MIRYEGVVLAGGSGSRMGSDKGHLQYRGMSFLERACSVLEEAGLTVRVAVARTSQAPDPGPPICLDRFPGTGPLGAVASALSSTEMEGCCFIPVDMPLLPAVLYRRLVAHAKAVDILIPRDRSFRLHPLCGLYSSRCAGPISKLVGFGERRVRAVCGLEGLTVGFLDPHEHGLPDRFFLNVNTPHDLETLI